MAFWCELLPWFRHFAVLGWWDEGSGWRAEVKYRWCSLARSLIWALGIFCGFISNLAQTHSRATRSTSIRWIVVLHCRCIIGSGSAAVLLSKSFAVFGRTRAALMSSRPPRRRESLRGLADISSCTLSYAGHLACSFWGTLANGRCRSRGFRRRRGCPSGECAHQCPCPASGRPDQNR